MFLIEKNVPLPPSSHASEKYPFRTMEIGDSFFWPGSTQQRVSSYASNASKDGRKFVTRADKTAGGVRCWRVA